MFVTVVCMGLMLSCIVAGYFGMTELEAVNDESVYRDQWSFER